MAGAFDEWDDVLHREDVDPLEILSAAARYQRYFVAIERQAIGAARGMGRTWEEIANAVGRSRQAVWQRYRGQPVLRYRPWVDLGPANSWLMEQQHQRHGRRDPPEQQHPGEGQAE